MVRPLAGWLLLVVLLGYTLAYPLTYHDPEIRPLVVVSELNQHLASHSHLQEPGDSRLSLASRPRDLETWPGDSRLGLSSRLETGDSRLGLPLPPEIEAIKKVAQILVTLGEQVIPTIIGDILPPPPHAVSSSEATMPVEDAPNDPVNDN